MAGVEEVADTTEAEAMNNDVRKERNESLQRWLQHSHMVEVRSCNRVRVIQKVRTAPGFPESPLVESGHHGRGFGFDEQV